MPRRPQPKSLRRNFARIAEMMESLRTDGPLRSRELFRYVGGVYGCLDLSKMNVSYPRAIQRLAISLACLWAADLLTCIFAAIRVKSLDTIPVGLLYAVPLSATIWLCGLWIGVVVIAVAAQLSWLIVPSAGVHAMVAGFLIWEERNRGAVLFPPRTLFNFSRVGVIHAFAAIIYIYCLQKTTRSVDAVRS